MKYLKWVNKNCKRLDNKNIIVTGANSGIGYEAAKYFAYLGAHVIMACRSLERANSAKSQILEEIKDASIDVIEYDQSSLESIDKFVKEYTSKYKTLYALVNNAGIYHPATNSKASNGYPLTIMTNYLGSYYLTSKMLEYIKAQEECTILFECSIAANFTKVKDYNYLSQSLKNTNIEYNLSKTAVGKEFIYYSDLLKDKKNIKVMMSHPGISSTNIFNSKGNTLAKWFKKLAKTLLPFFVHCPAKASLGLVKCVAGINATNNSYLGPRGLFELSGYPKQVRVSNYIKKDIDSFINETNKCIKQMEEHANARSK